MCNILKNETVLLFSTIPFNKLTKMGKKKRCHVTLLKGLKRLQKDELQEILLRLSDNSIDDLCEVLYNLSFSKLKIHPSRRRRLKRLIGNHLAVYHKITNKKSSTKHRRRLLVNQSGGSLGAIIAAGLPIIIDLVSRVFKKK